MTTKLISYSQLGFVLLAIASPALSASPIRELVDKSGVRGGLIVHLGCGDGQQTSDLVGHGSFVVHGIDTDSAKIQSARQQLSGTPGYGQRLTLDTFDGESLPYVDNLVNLLITEDLGAVPIDEVMRVLAPLGVAMIDGRPVVKHWPDEIDQWTHFLHGADNNAVANDHVVGPPRHMQWLAGPLWTRHHDTDKGTYPTIRAVVSAAGRLFYLVDETTSSNMQLASKWYLTARDGFSGVLLWKRPVRTTTYDRQLQQVWRTIVAHGNRIYVPLGTNQQLATLDALTGEILHRHPETEACQEVIYDGERLFVVTSGGAVLAVQEATGERLWHWAPGEEGPLVRLTLAASDGKVFAKTEQAAICLSAAEGRIVWKTRLPTAQRKVTLKYPHEKLVVQDGVVLCSYAGTDPSVLNRDKFEFLGSHPQVHAYGGKLAALSAEDGRILWTTDYLPGLESMPGEVYVSDGQVWLGPAFAEPRDLQTGKVTKRNPVLERLWTTGHHYRCYPGKATCRFILTAKRGIELIDTQGDNHSRNNWVRATCRVGVTPCNGLVYAPPHSCGCYMEAKLNGFWALAANQKAGSRRIPTTSERRETGPAFADLSNAGDAMREAVGGDAWPTYRCDVQRSASTSAAVSHQLAQRWRAPVGRRLSAPVVAAGNVLVADIDAHRVVCLDANDGTTRWSYIAGGRIDTPPTIHGQRVLFGSRDGWVYCVRLSDGALVWRFLAATERLNGIAWEQVESIWPVHGSVLIQDQVAYVAAGRSSYLDEGIQLHGLNPRTGEVVCQTQLRSEHVGVSEPPPEATRSEMATQIRQNFTDYKTFLAPDQSDAFAMRGALTDILSADGDSIYMRQLRFDDRLSQLQTARPHLFSTSSLLDDSHHHRSYWVLGTGDFNRLPVAYPWIVTKSMAVPYGLMMTFDSDRVWTVQRSGKKREKANHAVVAMPRPDPTDPANQLRDFDARSAGLASSSSWSAALSFRPRAILRAGNLLLVGGMPERSTDVDEADSRANAPADGGVLHALSADTGKKLSEMQLAASPAWDAMAAVNGRVYLALDDGSLVCLENAKVPK
jgi:outer membrane protein assembly factor BamB